MRTLVCTIGLLCAVCAPYASACGHCVEDKIAAVYDFSVVSKAQAMHRHIAFVAIDGSFRTDDKTRRAIEDIVRTAAGVDSASVRVSLELAALSFAFDPKSASFASIHRSIGRPLARLGLRVSEIKILDGTAKVQLTAKQ